MSSQPRTRLSTVMHSPTRLAILGILRHVQQINFADLQESLELSTSELSRQLGILEKENLVEIAKFRERRHAVTRVRLSVSGRERFREYLEELRKVVRSEIDSTHQEQADTQARRTEDQVDRGTSGST